MSIYDILIALGSIGLIIFTLPTLLNKNAQVPRKTSSLPLAIILSYMSPMFYLDGLTTTAITLTGQALVWWLIVIFRPIRKPNKEAEAITLT